MIIHIKTIPVATIITIATIISPAHAYLRSPSSLSPGDFCNTSCQTGSCGVMHKYNAPYIPEEVLNDFDQCTDESTQDILFHSCWINKTAGNYMLCSQPENACSLFSSGGNEDYHTLNSSKHSVQMIEHDSSEYYFCQASTQYGCEENYYALSGIGTSNISCTPCPSNGKSATGNVYITGCYLPSGTTGTDTTGNYKYTADCYYKK